MASLTIKKGVQWWYGRYRFEGVEPTPRLRVKIRGERPPSLRQEGCPKFEASRREAQAVLDRIVADVHEPATMAERKQAVYSAHMRGKKVELPNLDDLGDLWKRIPRKRKPGIKRTKLCLGWIDGFVKFIKKADPSAIKLHHVLEEQARAFMDQEYERGISATTWNDKLGVLKAAFKEGGANAFERLVEMDDEPVYREPYTPDELNDILRFGEEDELIYPMILTATSTALRLGDCCLLKWADVNFQQKAIYKRTAKTRAYAHIPLFDDIYQLILKQKGNDSDYVFPEQADQYKRNAKLFTTRLRKILAKAGFRDDDDLVCTREIDEASNEEVLRLAKEHCDGLSNREKAERILIALPIYLSGMCIKDTAAKARISPSTASLDFNELEHAIGIRFIRGKHRPADLSKMLEKRGSVHVEREQGLRKASIRDWHAFRTTWITLALASHMPIALVQKVTGHKTLAIIQEHYNRVNIAQIRESILRCRPGLLLADSGRSSITNHAISMLEQAKANDWKKTIEDAIEILKDELG